MAVLVMSQSVDDDGVVHRTPVGGAAVTLNVIGKWSLADDATQATEYNGRAAWTLTCTEEGAQQITAVVGGRDWPPNIPNCLGPAPTATTAATISTVPPGGRGVPPGEAVPGGAGMSPGATVRVATSTVAAAYFRAFSTRLATTWASRSGSATVITGPGSPATTSRRPASRAA